jgi:ankyrin repeat protein
MAGVLLRAGAADVNATRPDGKSALIIAAGLGFVDTVTCLVEEGRANLELKDSLGR